MKSFGTPAKVGQLAVLNLSKREAADWPFPLLNLSIRDVTEALLPRLPDGYSQIFRLQVFGPSGLKDYGSATLHCKI